MAKSKSKQVVLTVKKCVVEGQAAYGVTDGKSWFYFAYDTEDKALAILPHLNSPGAAELNVSQAAPGRLTTKMPRPVEAESAGTK